MHFSESELRQIVARASNLTERLQDDFIPHIQNDHDKWVQKRMDRWCQVVADGDSKKFQTRLAWGNLSTENLETILGMVILPSEQSLPWWTECINACLQEMDSLSSESIRNERSRFRFLFSEQRVPYEEVFVPFIQYASKQLIKRSGSDYELLSGEAHTQLERYLLQQLANVCAQTFHLEFSISRASKRSAFSQILAQQHSDTEDGIYWEFVDALYKGKLKGILFEYSVLCRLISTVLENWITAVAEFLSHLQTDWEKIQHTFQPNLPLDKVISVRTGLSDPHNQNRTVISLQFSTGLQLVYKPRNLALAKSFFNLLAWFNEHTELLSFKTLKVLSEGTHGWVEYVTHFPCQDHPMLDRYYKRTGMLLCLIYLLDGTDFHLENIIAHGEYPLLIDTETLLHHHFTYPEDEEDNARSLAEIHLNRSVLRTDFLPRWHWGEGEQRYDVSGIGGMSEPEISIRSLKWQQVNTNNMRLEYSSNPIKSNANLPSLSGSSITAQNYIQHIATGFEEMYLKLLENRAALLAVDGPIVKFKSHEVRLIFRNTKVYGGILNNTLQPKYLRAGIDRSIEIDVLSRAYLGTEEKPAYWAILQAEQVAIERLDVPLITGSADSDVLVTKLNKTIHNYLLEPSYESVQRRLQKLNREEMVYQMELIAVLLDVRFAATNNSSNKHPHQHDADIEITYTEKALTQRAIVIAEMLKQKAIVSRDGRMASWIGLKYVPEAACSQIVPLRDNLHSGASGVALFLAAIAKVTNREDLRTLALQGLQPLCRRLEAQNKLDRTALTQTGIGGVMGFGSMVYALVKISQFLEEPTLLEVAREVATHITTEQITRDQQFDVMDGVAGALLGLLALYEQSGEIDILCKAKACGEHLLRNRVASQSGLRAWITVGTKPLSGFSHGVAGIAYALLRLYSITNERCLLEAAEEAIAYENSLYCTEVKNWHYLLQDQTSSSGSVFRTAWCHGAPGIGLARLGGLTIYDTTSVREDISVALQTTKQVGLTEFDNLCCGNLGRTELFLVAAEQLSQPELLDFARTHVTAVLNREEQAGSFFLPHRPPGPNQNLFQWGFFHGLSGIGYELLRIACPEQLPSVLLWQ